MAIKHPLAFNVDREPIPVPRNAAGWRVRRVPSGSLVIKSGLEPELVVDSNGAPLYLSITASARDLNEAVSMTGLYRLDAVDADLRVLLDVEPAYCNASVDSMPVEFQALVVGFDTVRLLTGESVPLARVQEQPSGPAFRIAVVEPQRALPPKRES
jgi:hypothetical protein